MRFILSVMAGALLLAACSTNDAKTKTAAPSTSGATPAAPAATQKLIAVPPCQLLVPADEMIAGKFEVKEGSGLATAQCNRSWDREPADPGAAAGATRVVINARLYQNLPDATTDFSETATGAGGEGLITRGIETRGFLRVQIKIAEATMPSLGADEQVAWRVEFTRGSATDTYVQYFVYLRVKNTRAEIQTFAQNVGGAEAKGLLDDTQQIAKKQADRLRSFPATADPATATPIPPGAIVIPIGGATPTATPRP
jgi:hypothetical protein